MPATESMLPTGEPGGGSAPSWAHKKKKKNEKRGGGGGRRTFRKNIPWYIFLEEWIREKMYVT